jgi:hypothetical protein
MDYFFNPQFISGIPFKEREKHAVPPTKQLILD